MNRNANAGDATAAGMRDLRKAVEAVDDSLGGGTEPADGRAVIDRLLDALEIGSVRAATPAGGGEWHVHHWIKRGILAAFRLGRIAASARGSLSFLDVDTLPPRTFVEGDRIRIVPGGTAVRRGSHLAPGTVCMPPSYINVGAFIGEHTMVDSHALVGSCAQVGARVHLSAAAQIGGVLEPIGALPVIVEDDVFIGGGCGVYEGCLIRRGAVLAPGVVLSRSTPVYDLVHERVLRATGDEDILEIPSEAVVVPGTRPAGSAYARSNGISVYAPVIIKYRDAGTDAATSLEHSLRLFT